MIKFSVKHPIPMAMFIGILVAFGLLSINNTALDFFPDVSFPAVTVMTTYENVASEDIEQKITKPIENAVSTISGVKKVSSISNEGVSIVMVEFEWGKNLDFAAQDIRDRIGLIEGMLPEDAKKPIVLKFDLSQMPVIEYFLTSKRYTEEELYNIIKDDIKSDIEKIDGIASCDIMGGREKRYWIDIKMDKLMLYKLSFSDVMKFVAMNNTNAPAGKITNRGKDILLRTTGEYSSIDDIENQVAGYTKNGKPIFIKDIAHVSIAYPTRTGVLTRNNRNGMAIDIKKESGENTVKIVEKAKKKIKELEKKYPDISMSLTFDQEELIKASISNTLLSAIIGGLLAAIMIYIFLLSFRPTFIVSLAIPLSVILTFIAIYIAGYTLNTMVLAGFALGIGMLVDASIVVIENIFRHAEEGEKRDEAAINGTGEVWTAISASAFTNIIVFLPLLYVGGIIGQMTQPMAVTISVVLIASLLISVTAVPMLSSLIMSVKMEKRVVERKYWFTYFRNWYERSLKFVLKHRFFFMLSLVVLLILSVVFVKILGLQFMPEMDRSFGMIEVELPIGTSLAETENYLHTIEKIAEKEKGVQAVVVMAGLYSSGKNLGMDFDKGSNKGVISLTFIQAEKRKTSSNEIMRHIVEQAPKYYNAKVKVKDISRQFFSSGKPVEVKIYGNDLETLKEIAKDIKQRIKDIKGVNNPEVSIEQGKPEIEFKVRRMKAAYYGLTAFQIQNEIKHALHGSMVGILRSKGIDRDIYIRLDTMLVQNELERIIHLPIKTPQGTYIPLSAVCEIKNTQTPVSIAREKQSRVVTVSSDLLGRSTGRVNEDILKSLKGMSLPAGYQIQLGGEFSDIKEMVSSMIFALIAAIMLVYMVMVAQFESFKDPFIVMFSLPLAFIGVIALLLITGTTISVPSMVGMLILVGVAVNEGIVMVTFIKQLRKKGRKPIESVVKGSTVRLRPVLISGFTTIFGMLPMALQNFGHGAEIRSPMAISMIGGLISSILLTLYVIPILYTYFEGIKT